MRDDPRERWNESDKVELSKPRPAMNTEHLRHRLSVSHIHERIGRFRFLTFTMIVMITFRPFLDGFIALELFTDLAFVFIFFSGIYAFRGDPRDRRPYRWALALTVGFALLKVPELFGWSYGVRAMQKALVALFLILSLFNIARQIGEEQEVTMDLIFAACCGYLLLGIIWAFVYYFIDLAYPGSFKGAEHMAEDIAEFTYYSFVTLTTMGYGDIIPISKQARAMAMLEAITGQLYLAILMGRLVGAFVSAAQSKRH